MIYDDPSSTYDSTANSYDFYGHGWTRVPNTDGSGSGCCCGSGDGQTIVCDDCSDMVPARYRFRVTRIRDDTDPAGCLLDFDVSGNSDFIFDESYLHYGSTVCFNSAIPGPLACWVLPNSDPNGYHLVNACGTWKVSMSFYITCRCPGITPNRLGTWICFSAQAFNNQFCNPFDCPGVTGRISQCLRFGCSENCHTIDDLLGDYEVVLIDAIFGTQVTIFFTLELA